MANVSLCTVCVILIVLHKPEALSLHIDRSLCLETIIKFMHDQQKCHFNYAHANGLLKDDNVTCQTKCHVAINGIYSDDHKLGKVELKFGGKINEYEPCISTNTLPVLNMNITCLAWNEVKVPVGGYCTQNEQCQGNENSGVCEQGRCVCRAGYTQYNFKCLEVKVLVGGYCTQNEQCQINEISGVCEQGRCVCRAGYIQYNFKCLEGNLALNESCSFSEQCLGSPNASCFGRKCSCIEGYTAKDSTHCVQIKVPIGGYCRQNEQCQESEISGVCEHRRCVCKAGYIQYNLECHEGNIALNQPCSFSEQCAGSPYASCLGGKCSCIERYTAEESTCVQIKVPVDGYCMQNEQCQENENSGVCEQGRCVCRAGYIQYNLKCLEGNLALTNPCSFSEQCTELPYASCLGGKCSCIEGYTAEESTCVQIKVPVGGYCMQNEQCQGNEHSGVCEQWRCVCRAGYIQYNLKCLEGNLALNQSCSFSEQCAGSPYASCLGGKCSCIEGYTAEESTCVQTKVPIGGYCTQNEQCEGSDILGVCEHGRCVCISGYIQYNLKCLEGNLTLNQSCSFSEQCAGSPYASCLGEICSCIEGYTTEESTYCAQAKVPVGGYCTKNEQCQERENSGVCKHGRCVCRAGYILYNLKCLEETLALNQSCALSDQCAGSPNATCFGGKCTCIEGYSAENSTKCVQSREVTLPSSLQHHQEEAKIETTLGALFGGLFLGVVLTIVAVRIFYRRSKTYVNKREEPNVAFADNNRYSLAKIVNHGPFQNIETKDKKREVSPYACSKETWIYDNVYSKPRNRQTQEAIYNHLHEQVKQDDDDYYDHACAASAQIRDMED